jgi:hypothetical protein
LYPEIDGYLLVIYIAGELRLATHFNLRSAMEGKYEIFEQCVGGSVLRAVVPRLFDAYWKLSELAEITSNECYALHQPTKQIVARVNTENAK